MTYSASPLWENKFIILSSLAMVWRLRMLNNDSLEMRMLETVRKEGIEKYSSLKVARIFPLHVKYR